MRLSICIGLFVYLLLQQVCAQNLTGRWQWNTQGSGKDIQSDYLIELDLVQQGNRIKGLRTIYLKDYEDLVVNVEGFVAPDGSITIASKDVLQNKLPENILVATNFTYKLQVMPSSGYKQLEGLFYPREDTVMAKYKDWDPGLYNSTFKIVSRSPMKKLADTLSPLVKERMGLTANTAAPAKGTLQPGLFTDIQSRLTLPATDISIDLYDNGEIDGDSITLLVNNKVVAERQKLTSHPIHFTLKKEDFSDSTAIVMQALNLGSIPPNTALMIITAAGQRYDVRLSSDLKRQAAVLLYRKK